MGRFAKSGSASSSRRGRWLSARLDARIRSAARSHTPCVVGVRIEPVEDRRLFCAIHSGVGDIFDPSGAYDSNGTLPTYTARVNFGPTNTRGVLGYTLDTGDVYGLKPNGQTYGWTTGEINAGKIRRSHRSQDDRYDSFLQTDAGSTWELDVPNGTYTVRVAVGDADSAKGDYDVSVEGFQAVAGSASKRQRWLESTVTVAVQDGRLSLTTPVGEKLDFIDIVPTDGAQLSNPEPRQTANAAGRADGDTLGLTGLTLVNADTDADIQLLNDNDEIDLGVVGPHLNVRANQFGTVQSVSFDLDNTPTRTETTDPFALFGDDNGDYLWQDLAPGTHTLTVTPYGGPDATGFAGAPVVVHFNVVDSTAVPPPPTSPPPVSPPPVSPPPVSPPPLNFNFQPASAPTVDGYYVDSGETFGDRGGVSYGWTADSTDVLVDRDLNADQRLDTNITVKKATRWELAVPSGQYTVTVAVGDAAVSSKNNIWVEGVSLFSFKSQAAGVFATGSLTVSVTDGRLTIGIGSSESGLVHLDYLEVSPVTAPPPPGSPPPVSPPPVSPPAAGGTNFNFQPASAPTVDGYLVDSGETFGDRNGKSYGWTADSTDVLVDRNTVSDQRLDTDIAVKAATRWELAVPSGQYTVKVSVGDAKVSSTNNIWIEGVNLFSFKSQAAGVFASGALTVNVTDGRLTIGIGSSGSGLVRLDYVEVTPAGVSPPPVSPPPVSPPPVSPPPVSPPPVSPPPVSPPPSSLPTSITWKTMTQNPVARAEALGNVVNGKLYVTGGLAGKVPGTKDEYIAIARGDSFDPATNKWTRIADMPEPFTHTSSVVVGDTIWFVGGYVGNHPGPGSIKVWKYDTSDNKWSRGPDLPKYRGAGGAALIGNTIFFVGGMDKSRTIDESDMWSLDLTNQSKGWVTRPDMPTARNHLSVVANGGQLYAISGQLQQEQNQVALKAVEAYDPTTDTWSTKKSIPSPRSHVTSAVFNVDNRIVVIGGEVGYNQPRSEVYMYDPDTNSWTVIGNLPSARSTTVSGKLPDGRIIVSTGNSPTGTATTWIGTLQYPHS